MTKRLFWLMALLAVMVALTACSLGSQPREEAADVQEEAPVSQATSAKAPVQEAETPAQQQAEAPAEQPAEQAEAPAQEADAAVAQPQVEDQPAVTTEIVAAASTKYGLVSGPIDDRGFNQLAWEGLQRASQELGFEIKHSPTGEGRDYGNNFNELLTEGYTGIVSVGFGLSKAAKAASEANPEVMFLNVDFPSLTASDVGLLFSTDEPSFMAGYLAAVMSQSGVVCTYGGANTPPVLSFMVGFEHGAKYYNQQKGTNVQVLGWQTDPENQLGGEGVFAESFEDQDTGRNIAGDFFSRGCDIIFPVAGATGLGSAEAAQVQGAKVIGVDADQAQSNPHFANVYLTSVLKKIDVVVYEAVKRTESGDFTVTDGFRSNFIGTLSNGGVGLAPFYGYDAQVPQELKNELAQLNDVLMAGNLSTGWPIGAPAPAPSRPAVSEAQPPAADAGPAAPPLPAGSAPITLDALRNGTYLSDWTQSGIVTLNNAEYREPAAPGSATETVVRMSEYVAFGDLTGNGVDDAAVILITDPGGSGTFFDLAVMINKNGAPINIASIPLGDRVQIKSLAIQNGEIVVNQIAHGPDDAMCCPTQEETKRFSLNLVEEAPLQASPDSPNFAGAYNAILPSASSPGINVTLILGEDGSAQMISDYMNGEAPIIETGTWAGSGNSAAVSLTSLNGRPIDEEVVFEMQGNMLVSTVYDPAIFGSEGLKLNRQ